MSFFFFLGRRFSLVAPSLHPRTSPPPTLPLSLCSLHQHARRVRSHFDVQPRNFTVRSWSHRSNLQVCRLMSRFGVSFRSLVKGGAVQIEDGYPTPRHVPAPPLRQRAEKAASAPVDAGRGDETWEKPPLKKIKKRSNWWPPCPEQAASLREGGTTLAVGRLAVAPHRVTILIWIINGYKAWCHLL